MFSRALFGIFVLQRFVWETDKVLLSIFALSYLKNSTNPPERTSENFLSLSVFQMTSNDFLDDNQGLQLFRAQVSGHLSNLAAQNNVLNILIFLFFYCFSMKNWLYFEEFVNFRL